MDGSVISTQTFTRTSPRPYYGEAPNLPHGCTATVHEEGWTIGTDSVDPRKLQRPIIQSCRRDCGDNGGWKGGSSNSHGVSLPVDSRCLTPSGHQYHQPIWNPLDMDYSNRVVPRQNDPSSNGFVTPLFVDHPQRVIGNGFTAFSSPEHSLPGYEQIHDPGSDNFFSPVPDYALYQEPVPIATGNNHGQEQTVMWDAMIHDVPLSQSTEQRSCFGDATIMTPARDIGNIDSPLSSNNGEVTDADGSNALQKAGFHGHDTVVELLLDSGAALETRNARDQTTLHLAAQQGHSNVVKILLEKHADCNAKDRHGLTPLHLASKHGHEQVTGLLLKASVDVNACDGQGQNALHYASEGGFLAVVKLLVDGGITLNVRSKSGLTPLHRAAENGYDAVVRLLLGRGADVNATSDNG